MPNCRFALSFLLALTIAPCAVSGDDGEQKAIERRIVKEVVPRALDIVASLGHGDIENAIQIVEEMAGRKLRKDAGPFEDEHAKWRRLFQPFASAKPSYESAELIGIQHVSSQAHKISLIGHGKTGPMLFQIRVFEYRGKLQLTNVRFDGVWDRIELQIATIKNRMSRKYPIPAAKAAENTGATKN